MKYFSTRWTCVFALMVFPLVGCSDPDGDGTGGSGGTGGTAGTSGTGGGAETVELRLTATEGDNNILGTRLEGVE
ncbi:MAG: hypothetical protein JRF55_18225, partial [Deltaproteobacteria bacterium]|nr:hypothetical protein [Deltaproteobacteria bacterium]